jgi:hypothetical protein
MDTHRIRARDAALIRLRRLTAAVATVAGLLAVVFTGIAAKAFPGRGSHATSTTTVQSTPRTAARPATQTPPPLVPNGSQAQPPAPSTSAPPAPTPTPAPPVAVSGGS